MKDTTTWKRSKTSTVTGVLFIAAAVSSMVGLALYNPIFRGNDFLTQGVEHYSQIILGAIFELVLVCTAIGTAIQLFPILSRYDPKAALGYFTFRLLEVVAIFIGTISALAMLSTSKLFHEYPNQDSQLFTAIGLSFKSIYHWTFMIGPNFLLGVNTFIYANAFRRYKTVPSKLAWLGITGAILIFLASLLELFGLIEQISLPGILLAVPIFLYEMSLAVWLISKGLSTHSQESSGGL